MENWLLSPPVIFTVILALLFILNRLFRGLAFHSDKSNRACSKSYACGENNFDSNAQPDYSIFFPFAFFFTLAHVTTLMITTIPLISASALVVAMLYIIGGIIGLYVLLRK